MARTIREQQLVGKHFGRRGVKHDVRTLKFRDYLTLPPIPASSTRYTQVASFPMMGNDQYGDCVMAGVGHTVQTVNTIAGHPFCPTDKQVTDAYFALTGGADNGLYLTDALKPWKSTGFWNGHKIVAYAALTPGDWNELQAAISILQNVFCGVELSDTNTFGPWIQVIGKPDPSNGHCIYLCGYSETQGYAVTWGEVLPFSPAWYKAYSDEAYVVVTEDWLQANGTTVDGFNLQQLLDDAAAISGGVTPPVNPVPTINLSAHPTAVAAGDSATLTWTTQDATACVLQANGSSVQTSVPVNGSLTVTPDVTTSYTITATGPGGSVGASVAVTVSDNPPPSLAFTVDKPTITAGESATLSWISANATAVSGSGALSGDYALDGQITVTPTSTTLYELIATGPGGSITQDVTVTVTSPAPGPGCLPVILLFAFVGSVLGYFIGRVL